MGLDLVGAIAAKPTEISRERGGAKDAGFPALMDSVLDGASERPKPEAPTRKTSSDATERRQETAASHDGERREARPSEARGAEKAASRRSEKQASDAEPEAADSEAPLAADSAKQEVGEREPSSADEDSLAREEEAAELVAAASAPIWTPEVAAAVPDLEGVGPVDAGAAGPVLEVLAPDLELAGEEVRSAASEDAFGFVAETDRVESEPITKAPTTIVDARAREAALSVVATLEEGEAKDESGAPVLAAEEAPVARTETLAPLARSESGELRRDADALDPRRLERFEVGTRAAEVAGRSAIAQTGLGSDSASPGAQRDGGSAPKLVLEVPDAKAGEPAPTAAATPASAFVEASLRGASEGASQGRLDASAFANLNRTPEAAPALPTGRPQPAAAPDAIAIQADWLATRGGGSARLVLHPPELGEIAIRVTVRQQSVGVVMVAQTALAHSMAEEQGDRLAQAFSHRDLRLDQFEVRRGDPSDSSSTGQFGSSDAGARERERAGEGRDGESGRDAAGGRAARDRNGERAQPVVPPRIVTTAHAAGIDLRI